MSETQPIFDAQLELKDAGLVASSAAAQVDAANKIIDLGAGEVHGDMFIDVSAIEIASNNELYEICLEGSSSATFASTIVTLARLHLGAHQVLTGGNDTDSTTGRYVVPFRTEQNGTVYRYVRAYTVVSGTVATGINYTALLTRHR